MLVLDLPQIYTCPTASILLQTLTRLAIKPASWRVGADFDRGSEDDVAPIDEHGIPKYLTSIISNKLQWIEDEDDRERIWEAASARLSERSGRSGKPDDCVSCPPNCLKFSCFMNGESPSLPLSHYHDGRAARTSSIKSKPLFQVS